MEMLLEVTFQEEPFPAAESQEEVVLAVALPGSLVEIT